MQFPHQQGVTHLQDNDKKPEEHQRLTEEQKVITQLLGQLLAAQNNPGNSEEKEPNKLIGFP
jgi:hypothetical protein